MGRAALLLLLLPLGCHRWSSDPSAAAGLQTLKVSQQDFRDNDRDEDGVKNYWVKDVAGLYGLDTGKGPMQLIDISCAGADQTRGRGRCATVKEGNPYIEHYWFATLKRYREDGKGVAYDDGTGRNPSRFGLVAFPAEYRRGSLFTFITNEKNITYAKDTRGKPPDEFPENPAKEGWMVFDRSR